MSDIASSHGSCNYTDRVLERFICTGMSGHAHEKDGLSSDSDDSFDSRPEYSHPAFENGMLIRDQDVSVSIAAAIKVLTQSNDIIKSASSPDQPWQHARDILDVTAAALDDAGLAMEGRKGKKEDAETEKLRCLAKEVFSARMVLLGRSISAEGGRLANVRPVLPADRDTAPLVVYATQTGNAKKFSMELTRKLETIDSNVKVWNMKDITLRDIASRKRVYFICSTFGLGRPPRDGESFFAAMQLDNGQRPFSGVKVAIGALGNSKFGDFISFGRSLSQELQGLGAETLCNVTPFDCKKGKDTQKAAFRRWQAWVLKVEQSIAGRQVEIHPASSDTQSVQDDQSSGAHAAPSDKGRPQDQVMMVDQSKACCIVQ